MSEFLLVLKSFPSGVSRHPGKFFSTLYLAFAGLWTVFDAVTRFKIVSLDGSRWFWVICVISILGSLWRCKLPSSVTFRLPRQTTKITICQGNILFFDGDRIIGVSDFIDSKVGDLVSEKSLHGQCIQHLFGGDSDRFENECDFALAAISPAEEVRRAIGRSRRYGIGTVAPISHGNSKIYLSVICRTDLATNKSETTLNELTLALERIWEMARTRCNGRPIAIPLLGTGRAGLSAEYRDILRLILLTYEIASKKHEITKNLFVFVTAEAAEQLELTLFKEEWSK